MTRAQAIIGGLLGLTVAVSVAENTKSPSDPGTMPRASDTTRPGILPLEHGSSMLLEPEQWPGQPLPLLPHIDVASRLARGKWIILVHNGRCESCAAAVSLYEELAAKSSTVLRSRGVAVISAAPSPGDATLPVPTEQAILRGRLTGGNAWLADFPLVAAVDEGSVRAVASGAEAAETHWLHELNSRDLRSLEGSKIKLGGVTHSGRRFSSASWEGKVILVDFWATWCAPCRRELPRILQLYRRYHVQGLEVLGISNDLRAEDLRRFLGSSEGKDLCWPQLIEEGALRHPLSVRYGVDRFPTQFLIGRNGIVRSVAPGDALEAQVKLLLAEPSIGRGSAGLGEHH